MPSLRTQDIFEMIYGRFGMIKYTGTFKDHTHKGLSFQTEFPEHCTFYYYSIKRKYQF